MKIDIVCFFRALFLTLLALGPAGCLTNLVLREYAYVLWNDTCEIPDRYTNDKIIKYRSPGFFSFRTKEFILVHDTKNKVYKFTATRFECLETRARLYWVASKKTDHQLKDDTKRLNWKWYTE